MNILVTAIGSFSADCVINTLKSSNHYVVGCDVYPSYWHAVSKDCQAVYMVPFAKDEKKYVQSLLDISSIENIDVIFPLTDVEIDILNKNRLVFDEKNIILAIQSQNCLQIARDKYKIFELFCNDSQVYVPKSINSSRLTMSCQLPVIAKPINGRSSEGLIKITTYQELEQIKNKDNYIIQEFLDGNVFTVDYARDDSGNDFAVPREELLRTKNGAGTTIRIVRDEYLTKTVSYIGQKLGIVGVVNMEFIKNGNTFYLIDINPRFSAGVAFSNYIGYDMITSHLNCFIGKTICTPIEIPELIIYKRFKEEHLEISHK